jgi:hypothetical protein
MNTIGKIMGTMLFLLCLAGIARADDNRVGVTGKGEIKARPDVAYVTVYVKAEGAAMADAGKEADQKVDEVKTAIQKAHKEIQSIEVSEVTVGEAQRQVWTPTTAGEREDSPHPEITRRIRIATVPKPAKIYELIDTALAAGALMQVPSSIHYPDDSRNIVVYGLLKPEPLEAKAREAAMADARKEAQSLAALAGKKVGGVVNIGRQESYSPSYVVRMMGRESDAPTRYSSLNAKEVTVTCGLSVTFELK